MKSLGLVGALSLVGRIFNCILWCGVLFIMIVVVMLIAIFQTDKIFGDSGVPNEASKG